MTLSMSDYALEDALAFGLDIAVVVGLSKEGDFYFGSTTKSAAEIVFLLQHGIWRLNQQTEKEMGGEGRR